MYIKFLVSFVLYLSSIFWIGNFFLTAKILYTGIIIPLLYQKIWFGKISACLTDNSFMKNILWTLVFIISSVFAADVLLWVKMLTDASEGGVNYESSCFFMSAINRLMFYFACMYLWNVKFFQKCNDRLLNCLFRFIQTIYLLIALPTVLLMLYILLMDVFVLVTNFLLFS